MKAAQLFAAGDLRITEIPPPTSPQAGEVEIQVKFCGICGTDAHEWQHGGPMSPLHMRHPASGHVGPLTIGHEFTGTITAVGAGVEVLRVGDRVVCGAGVSCRECRNCLRGRTNLCENYFTFGLSRDGGMAEVVVVPERICVKVPEDCPDLRASLAQPMAIAMHAVSRANLADARSVLVVGAGGIGALVIAALSDLPVRVIVADLSAERLQAARRLGADQVLQVGESPLAPAIDVDASFETSGSESGLTLAVGSVGRGGQVIVLGLPTRPVATDIRRMVIDEVDIITSSAHVCSEDLPAAIELLSRRAIDKVLVSHVISLDDIVEQGLARLATGDAGGKIIVEVADASHHATHDSLHGRNA